MKFATFTLAAMVRAAMVLAAIVLASAPAPAAATAFAAAPPTSIPASNPATPDAAAAGFYRAVIALNQGGIPDAKGLASLRPRISAPLTGLLAAADSAELRYADNTKHAVPPLLEGDIFVSLFEGATGFAVKTCSISGGRADCLVDLSYRDGGAGPTRWSDTARLVHEAAGWRVDDVRYGAGWEFANQGTLQENLRTAIANANGK